MAANKFNAGALRHLLQEGTDDEVAAFLDAYALGDVADRLIALLSPMARQAFFLSMRERYPECFGARPSDRPS